MMATTLERLLLVDLNSFSSPEANLLEGTVRMDFA